jgi:ATP-dependent DNA helicase RecG
MRKSHEYIDPDYIYIDSKTGVLRNIANLMQRLDYIEKMGTGILRMQKLLSEAGLPPLKYEFSTFVHAIFYRFPENTPQVTEQVTEQATEQATEQVEGSRIKGLLAFCSEPRSREEIQQHIGLKHREHFRSEILQPLLKEELLIPTIPNKPNSPKQRYVAKGAGNE